MASSIADTTHVLLANDFLHTPLGKDRRGR
jgi:hypothetical protein